MGEGEGLRPRLKNIKVVVGEWELCSGQFRDTEVGGGRQARNEDQKVGESPTGWLNSGMYQQVHCSPPRGKVEVVL